MKKKICFFSGAINRSGGTERVSILIANSLAKLGYDVTILSLWDHGKPYFFVDKSVSIAYLLNPRKEGKLYRTWIYPIIKLHNFIQKNKFDIFIDIDTLLSNYTNYAIKYTKTKWISWEHFNYEFMISGNTKKRRIHAKKLIAKNADLLIVLTEEDKIMHIKNMQFPIKKIKKIYNPSPFKINKSYNYNTKTFFSAGRLTWQKGYDLLLRSWQIFERQNKEWKLIIAGDGEEKEKLEKMIKEFDLKRVRLIGEVENISYYYSNSACYILSSRYEGFPMVILEAESFSLPIISFNCKTGPKEMIKGNGFLIQSSNIEQLAKYMLDFTLDEDKANKMSQKSVDLVRNLSVELIIKQWDTILSSM